MIILAIDPGIDTGWASFEDGRLTICGLGDPRVASRPWPDKVIIEKPQVYRAAGSKGDPNDLITLAVQVGEYRGYFEDVSRPNCGVLAELVLPFTWKRQLPKSVCHTRVKALLDRSEMARMEGDLVRVPESLRHNVMDAVGIGMWLVGRFRP